MAMAGDVLLRNQHFINNVPTVPIESLLGLVSCNPQLALFDFANVVVRKDYEEMDEVKLIAGGASGHEPCYAGFVGKGMLTAAIQGDIYIAPSSLNILRTILELSTERCLGVLAIIANNCGDRLNFGLAIERAQSMGIKARLLVVTDDCSMMPKPREKRGLTGVFIVQKIAGELAKLGKTVEEIYDFCDDFQKNIFSISVSIKQCKNIELGSCYTCEYSLPKISLEIAAGLHGETGNIQMPLTSAENICKIIFNEMTNENNEHKLMIDATTPVIVLVNNLGSASKLEVNIFTKEILSYLRTLNVPVIRVIIGKFITSIDMHGFIITIIQLKDPTTILPMLDEKVDCAAWVQPLILDNTPDINMLESKNKPSNNFELRGPRLGKRQANTFLLVIQFACDALISCEKQINIIDSEFGDGDAGTRIKQAAVAINGQLPSPNLNCPFVFLLKIGSIFETATGGTTGCLYAIMFEAAGKQFMDVDENLLVDGKMWLQALKRAISALIMYTHSKEGDMTLIDPLCTCARVMEESLNSNMSDVEAFGMAVASAEETAQRTKIEPRSYPDPGAHAVGIWLRAVYEGVKLRCE
ncbi:triokinase/FMN cyclase-like [Onthophagus taurus]|uniref:triokinase/FMN cyclase-like n=1 Tax=Onthophagus taurus TaxID=166361 RepID=UPI000C20A7E7|nr:triokinase/FMN cyclase-like [Onthophagus taurus]